jgi:hypothetical protein
MILLPLKEIKKAVKELEISIKCIQLEVFTKNLLVFKPAKKQFPAPYYKRNQR